MLNLTIQQWCWHSDLTSRNSKLSLAFDLWLELNFSPWSVPRVWSLLGLAEPSACIPVILSQGKSVAGSGCNPHRELWNVHSLSGGHDPFTLLQTCTSSRAILPSVPPKVASKMNFTQTCTQCQTCFNVKFAVYFVCEYTLRVIYSTCTGPSLLAKLRSAKRHLLPCVPVLVHMTVSVPLVFLEINLREPENPTGSPLKPITISNMLQVSKGNVDLSLKSYN